ncbi:MAG TPA: hypothetical protein VNO21_11785, partial [Polyangiaceae bacterium]|nr:hypothetical protein [Polyangiaceae bacterium]
GPLGDAIGPAWTASFADNHNSDIGLLFVPSAPKPKLAIFGGRTSTVLGGASAYSDEVYFASLDGSSLEAPTLAAHLTAPRASVMAIGYGGFIYAIGGQTDADWATADVDMLEVDGKVDGAAANFVATKPMHNAANGQPYQARDIALCTGDHTLYAVGGAALSDPLAFVLMTHIQDDGHLSDWQSLTPLPAGRSAAGCFVAHGQVYVLGGRAGAPIADVLSAPVLLGDTLGGWDTRAPGATTPHQPLPAPRAHIAVTAY